LKREKRQFSLSASSIHFSTIAFQAPVFAREDIYPEQIRKNIP
jgi:hypothetical protein